MVSLDQFESLPWCNGCGLCPGLTTGWFVTPLEEPEVLFCMGCGTPVVWLA